MILCKWLFVYKAIFYWRESPENVSICTNKGILVTEVEFDGAFWKAIVQRLTAFCKTFMMLELLT